MRRHCLYAVLLLCFGWSGAPALAAGQPNILLVIADDVGFGDLRSFHPAAVAQTPNIDALAAQGMRFDRFYTDSTCSASRAALLTGQHPARLGFHPVARGIAPDLTTLPEWLRAQGYSTHHVGKWHIGELNAEAKPLAQGFDSSFGFLNQWFLQGPDATGKPQLRAPVYRDPWLEDGHGSHQYRGYLPDILTQHAREKIAALSQTAQPWFLWYATPLAHGPLHEPPGADSDGSEDGQYRAMLHHLDHNVGELLAALEQTGQRDNTIIIFLSDNGAPEKRKGSNAGFAGGKAHYSEGAVRTPMIWIDKSQVLPASLDQRAISIADIFPTLAARIGAPLPFTTDGLDFNKLENVAAINQRRLFWLSRGSASLLSVDLQWRLVDEWMLRQKKALRLWRINENAAEDRSQWRYVYIRLVAGLQQDLSRWLETVSRTSVQWDNVPQDKSQPALRITGNDFLRTPLKEWDFYVAVSVTDAVTEQVLAEQAGIWSMVYQPSLKQLAITMHGHRWVVPVAMTADCTLIGLNADVYDRYTNTGNEKYPTELRLSINGKEEARTEWQVDSLADVKIGEPTWLGISAAGDRRWQGKLSVPALYHRASVVGEWPYFIDEQLLRTELCGGLQ